MFCLCPQFCPARLGAGRHEDQAGWTVSNAPEERWQEAVHNSSPITELLKGTSCSPETTWPQPHL